MKESGALVTQKTALNNLICSTVLDNNLAGKSKLYMHIYIRLGE